MDQLARNEELQAQLERVDWDLVVVDEAHRMSAHYFGAELEEDQALPARASCSAGSPATCC